jgi:transposase InsO family protein
MPYTTNPAMPRLRARAVDMVRNGKSIREVARHFGFNPTTVMKWARKSPFGGVSSIPTESSRPKSHLKQKDTHVINRVKELRIELNGRCAEVITKHLNEEGIEVHRITVQRILDKLGMTKKKSKWKKHHLSGPRPTPIKPGDLVQMDTIHLMVNKKERIYIYTLIDVYSRWVYALATNKISAGITVQFFKEAMEKAGFEFNCIQTDHGPEFTQYFTNMIQVRHRHSRVRKPNDNAHIERFNRTIQDELLRDLPVDVKVINRALPKYLDYYNTKRYHLGINLKTPSELIAECCQAIV